MVDAHPVLRRELSFRDVVLLNVAAIVSTRRIASARRFEFGKKLAAASGLFVSVFAIVLCFRQYRRQPA